jgi:putative ABC transport system permease protein
MKYDKFHKKSDRIYRLLNGNKDMSKRTAIHPVQLLPAMIDKLPEVKDGVRMEAQYKNEVITVKENKYLSDVAFADSNFFRVFSFQMIKGDPVKALSAPSSVILTQSAAEKYFGDADPMGKVINLKNKYDLTVNGIMKDIPEQSHIQSDILISFKTLKKRNPYGFSTWNRSGTNIYMLLKPDVNVTELENKITNVHEEVKPKGYGKRKFMLQPLERVYLHSSNVSWDFIKKGNIEIVTVLSIVAVLILLIACFNYMNLTTANFTKEANQTGIQRTLGAKRKHLVSKYFLETFIISLLALWLAIIAVELALPYFNQFTGKHMHLQLFRNPNLSLSLLTIFLFTIIIGGAYPSLFLTSFKPITALKKIQFYITPLSNRNNLWRKGFVVVQFGIATVLIIASIILYKQIQLITEKKTGINKDLVITVENPWGKNMNKRYQLFTDKIKKKPSVISCGCGLNIPGERINNYGYLYKTRDKEHKYHFGQNVVSHGYFEVLKANFKSGRNFSPKMSSDSNKVIINKEASKKLGIKDPVGKRIIYPNFKDEPVEIIGVVNNIQYSPLYSNATPVIYFLQKGYKTSILVKIQKGQTSEVLQSMGKTWNKVSSEWPFRYEFLDKKIEQVYKMELKTLTLIKLFSALAIFLSCMGLFGFAGYSIKRRTKEIGIRKVNGATATIIMVLLNKDFIKWVFVAFLIGSPVAYYLINKWLQNYAYKTQMSWWVFALSGLIVLLVAVITVSWQSWRAARQNPVDSLRYE